MNMMSKYKGGPPATLSMPQPNDFDNVQDYKKAMEQYRRMIKAEMGQDIDLAKMQSTKNSKFMV